MTALDNSRTHSTEVSTEARFFVTDRESFREQLNRNSFIFDHRSANHPLFELPRLGRLAELVRQDPKHFYYMTGNLELADGWQRGRPPMSLGECVQNIGAMQSWIILKHCEQDPDYGQLTKNCMREFAATSGWDIDRETAAWELQVMISSPRQLTPYHIDNECNFLYQIAGQKTISICDPADRSILTEEELEGFWMHNINSAKLKPGAQARARTYQLRPGKAVHIPVNAPHWVQNGEAISISVSINCELVGRPWGTVFQANHYLRRLGLRPLPPGQSVIRDRLKHVSMVGAKKIRRTLLKPLGRG